MVGHLRWQSGAAGSPILTFEMRRWVSPKAIRVFRGISAAWELSFVEEMALLGLPRPVWSRYLRGREVVLPCETLRRIALTARVFEAVNMLFPPHRADTWMRSPNSARLFAGRTAVDLMVEEGRAGVRAVRLYLLGEIYG